MACELHFIIVYFLNTYFYTYILIYMLILVTEKMYIKFTEESKKKTHNIKKENNILYFILNNHNCLLRQSAPTGHHTSQTLKSWWTHYLHFLFHIAICGACFYQANIKIQVCKYISSKGMQHNLMFK